MSEEKIYQRITEIDEKHSRRADELRAEMNMIVQSFQGHISDMTTSAAILSERFKQMREQVITMPKPESRPCPYFNKHMEDHEKVKYIWIKTVISAIVASIVTAVGTAMAVLHGNK